VGGQCSGDGCKNGGRGRPVKDVARAAGLPAPPTSVEKARPADPNAGKCKFDCQAWNPASNSCVGAPMNGCK
jgi:hypothetical protein